MDYDQVLQGIRTRCRMAMNGDASAGMRKYGLSYKLNFGLMIAQIKEIASRYKPDSQLASLLWETDTRELKILATLLFPLDEFTEQLAESWATQIVNQEIREQLTINLLQRLPFSQSLAIAWAGYEDKSLRTTAYWLLARLQLLHKNVDLVELDAVARIWSDLFGDDSALRNSALLALKYLGRGRKEKAQLILEKVGECHSDDLALKQELLDSLSFEFEFFS